MTLERLVERLVAVINASDLDALAELYSVGYVDHDPLPGQSPGVDGVRAGLEMLTPAEVTPRFHLEDCFSSGDRVAYRIFGSWEVAPQFLFESGLGSRPTLTLSGAGIFRCRDGRFVERWGHWVVTSSEAEVVR